MYFSPFVFNDAGDNDLAARSIFYLETFSD